MIFITTPQPFLAAAVTFPAKTSVVHMGFDDPPRLAERRGLLCNMADRPEACNFILLSVANRGDLIIAISTSGKSAAFKKNKENILKRNLETNTLNF